MRAFRHRDFRLLWIGAFLSFTGSWIQTIAQGWLIYQLTGDKAMLALVAFFNQIPVSLIGPFAGTLPDLMNRRVVLVLCQLIFACGALFLAAMIHFKMILPVHILIVAMVGGIAGAFEMPTRQTIVSRVVPPEDLPSAIPLNALTFNLARVVGPALGGIFYAAVGPEYCYLINGCSFFFLIFAIVGIKADLRATRGEAQPILDLVVEGVLYTFRDQRLKVLFILEGIVSSFGLFYIAQMPAIAKDMLGLDEKGFGLATTFVGIGAISSLLLVATMSHRPIKAMIVRLSMSIFGIALTALGFASSTYLAFPVLAILGFCTVAQFNTTNTLFQLFSPDRLRGRVLAMHVWALNGLSPIGTLLFGWLASHGSLPLALQVGGACVIIGAIWGWTQNPVMREIQ